MACVEYNSGTVVKRQTPTFDIFYTALNIKNTQQDFELVTVVQKKAGSDLLEFTAHRKVAVNCSVIRSLDTHVAGNFCTEREIFV